MDRETQGIVGTSHTDDLGREARPSPQPYATQFARDLALALTDPVIVALLAQIVRQGIEHDRIAQSARAIAERDTTPPAAPTNIQRASRRTDWVGRQFAREQALRDQERDGLEEHAAQPEGGPA